MSDDLIWSLKEVNSALGDQVNELHAEIATLRAQLSEANAKLERLHEYSAEGWGYASAWCKLHDQVVGWIQKRPAAFKEFVDTDPRGPLPSPDRIKAELERIRREARERALAEAANAVGLTACGYAAQRFQERAIENIRTLSTEQPEQKVQP